MGKLYENDFFSPLFECKSRDVVNISKQKLQEDIFRMLFFAQNMGDSFGAVKYKSLSIFLFAPNEIEMVQITVVTLLTSVTLARKMHVWSKRSHSSSHKNSTLKQSE